MFKIAIDCRCLTWSNVSGIRRYLINILKNLPDSNNTEFYFLTNKAIDFGAMDITTKSQYKAVLLVSNDFIYKFIKTPYFLYSNRINAYWSPTPDLPLFKPYNCKYYVTLHDIFFEHKPKKYNYKIRVLKLLGYYKYISHLSDIIITDSEFVKKDIIDKYEVDSQKIIVCYLAVDPNISHTQIHEARRVIFERFGIQKSYIFHIDCADPIILLRAYSELVHSKFKASLVILGGVTPKIEQFVSSHNISNSLVFIYHHVGDYELSCLYSAADCFITTSADEGFGLAPLEALSCGCQVILPNSGCLPEIYADSAKYYEYANLDSLKSAILESTTHKKHVDKYSIFSKYSWENTSIKISTILHSSSF